jgi:hypothetical protein
MTATARDADPRASAGRGVRRAVLAGIVLLLAWPAGAQTPRTADSFGAPGFFTHSDFHLSATSIRTDDRRFRWDADFGGDVDLVDYGVGRFNLLANYEAILGTEYRAIDPNQGNYLIDLSSSLRINRSEVAAVFHHMSRHRSDRSQRFSVSWNSLGVRASREVASGPLRIAVSARVAKVTTTAFVDYAWEAEAGTRVDYKLRDRFGLLASSNLVLMGVNATTAQRGRQSGGRVEAGLNVVGSGAVCEVFLAVERRIDADPLDRLALNWMEVGFRFLSR